MKKSAVGVFLSLAFSTSVLATELTFEEGTIIVPNDSVTSFEVTDLDNNGTKDLVYINTSGELKFAKQKPGGSIPGPGPGKRIEITEESAQKYILNSVWYKKNNSPLTFSSDKKGYVKNSNCTRESEYQIFAGGFKTCGVKIIYLSEDMIKYMRGSTYYEATSYRK